MDRISKLTTHLTSAVMQDPGKDAIALTAKDLFSLRGKVALVSGGSKGIGLMMAKGLVSNGAKVYICARKADVCEAAVKELNTLATASNSGGAAVSLPGDLSSIEGVTKVASSLQEKEPKLHILVNNAGATWGATLEEYPDKAWEKIMNLNVRHLFNLTQKCLPMLKAAGVQGDPARVVNISSTDGVRATQTAGPTAAFAYTTSKGAVEHLSKALCRALAEFQITVNSIAPGLFPSNMTKFVFESGSESIGDGNPLGRVGRTADVAGTIVYLCSPAGSWTNGATIVLDGGQHLF
mmetsp:Transcript_12469/g.23143  ORF Transcript_12469/g.23143 Transcript_12469/m.23143 type:complete len:294 (-) Transcript_12469:129-1010(-)